jgi:hypothetical protein
MTRAGDYRARSSEHLHELFQQFVGSQGRFSEGRAASRRLRNERLHSAEEAVMSDKTAGVLEPKNHSCEMTEGG